MCINERTQGRPYLSVYKLTLAEPLDGLWLNVVWTLFRW
jgi:hypothetical protein